MVHTASAERPSWEENEASLGLRVGQRPQEKGETEAVGRTGCGERQHICFGDMVSCGQAGLKLTM